MLNSLKIEDNIDNIFKSGEGAGKSGSFFFFSNDNQFIIKTMRGNEKQVLLNMLDDMIKHLDENDQSLLARIYGVFSIKASNFHSVDIIIMQNTVQMQHKNNQKMTFDLKGSLYGRKEKFKGQDANWWQNNRLGHKRILKEKNFLEINRD